MNALVVDTDVISFAFKKDTRAEGFRRLLYGRPLLVSFMTEAEFGFLTVIVHAEAAWSAPRLAVTNSRGTGRNGVGEELMTLTIELTDEQAETPAQQAANAGEPIADYVRTLVGEAALWREELARRQSWVRDAGEIRERGLDASDLDFRTLVDEGRH